MEGLGLLVGHLIGDYVVQNDWMARCKVAAHPGPSPTLADCERALMPEASLAVRMRGWRDRMNDYRNAGLACTVHCLLYTLAVWLCSCWWMPWWGLFVCFTAHWPIDRYRLAGRWMRNVSGQAAFATGPLAPWSVIVVDNVFHLATLFVIGLVAGR